jgi:putative ABC transport system permease protein
MDLSGPRYAENPAMQALARRAVEQLSAIPGVRSVALEGPGIVTSGTFAAHLRREGDNSPKPVDYLTRRHTVTPGYFKTMGIPMLAGRDFGDEDTPTSPRSIIISQALAERVWPGESAVGRVLLTTSNPPAQLIVVGVVKDVVHSGLDPEAAQSPDVYLSFYQQPPRSPSRASFLIRYAGAYEAIAPAVQRSFKELAPDLPLFDIQSMEARLASQTRSARMMVLLMSIFAMVALTLAAIGIFGVVSYMASQRYRELGIRVALGATRRNILWQVVRSGMTPVLIGLGVGVAGTWAMTRVLVGMLYGVNPLDPIIIIAMAAIMIACAVLGSALPAMRASRVDPQIALSAE